MLQEELDNLGGNWLLMVDDVWNGGLIHQSLQPSNKGCKLLIISRYPLNPLSAIWIKVDEWNNTDLATKLLANKATNEPE
jgi:hypothetical protein